MNKFEMFHIHDLGPKECSVPEKERLLQKIFISADNNYTSMRTMFGVQI